MDGKDMVMRKAKKRIAVDESLYDFTKEELSVIVSWRYDENEDKYETPKNKSFGHFKPDTNDSSSDTPYLSDDDDNGDSSSLQTDETSQMEDDKYPEIERPRSSSLMESFGYEESPGFKAFQPHVRVTMPGSSSSSSIQNESMSYTDSPLPKKRLIRPDPALMNFSDSSQEESPIRSSPFLNKIRGKVASFSRFIPFQRSELRL